MLKPLFVLVFGTFVFFITPSEGSSYSSAEATSAAAASSYHSSSSSYSSAVATSTATASSHHPPTHVYGWHEIYSTCINSDCQPRTCADLDRPIAFCPKYDKTLCIKGCTCEHDYFRDEYNVCIPKQNCSHICCENEIYSTCSNGECGPKTCDQQGYKIGCPKMDEKHCIGGCICKDGYLRDQNGECIPKSMCPECGGDPNAISNDDEDTCKCRDGFTYDETIGKCVLPKDCQPKCGINERYEKCPQLLCTPQKCSQLGFPWPAVPCPVSNDGSCPGKPGCVCIDDYVRNDHGKCIPKQNCPSCGGDPHAVAGCGLNCGRLCSNYDKGPVACPKICLPNACDCKKGYVFDEKLKKCVKPRDCTKCTKPHEFYDSCPPNCSPQTCESIGKEYPCLYQPLVCRGACRCEPGYYRDRNGDCILEKHCPPQCPVGEVYEKCPDNLCTPQTCSQLGFPVPCPKSVEVSGSKCLGKPRCVCAHGNVRNENGKCIPKDQCPSCGGDSNATPGCGVNCGKKCSDYKVKNPVCPMVCDVNGCDCKKGYVYDDNCKKCVLPSECTETCGVNEVYDTCANRGCRKWRCSQPELCKYSEKCEGGCVCRDKYTRADNGTCIPEDQCEPQCPIGEIFEKCPDNLCTPLTCSQLGFPIPCPSGSKCLGKPRCICANGNVRDENGKCIPKHRCPSCGGDSNATPGCGVNCGKKCSDYKEKNHRCLKNCHFNGCDCKKGYVYDDNCKKCVLPSECTPTCGLNEVYDTCANRGCRRWNCSQSEVCYNPKRCEAGCSCQDGYSRNKNGVCIPEKQCPGLCSRPHEYYDDCPQTCPPQTCESIGKVYDCPAKPLHSKCKGRCMCEKGYFRNLIGECIREEDCRKCPGPHEYFSCGGACDNVCATLHEYNQTNCPIINIMCNHKCYCEKGYARDKNNICIPIHKCPEPQCPVGEVYEKCPDNLCTPQTCSQLGFPVPCPKALEVSGSKCLGKPRCVCAHGNVRDENGKCIPKDQCPSCGGDPNATPGCGVNCGKKCSDYRVKNHRCPKICHVNGCDCKKGYVYDDNCKKCVLPSECTETCGINEVYDTCANRGCRKWRCSQPEFCKRSEKCEGGCVCRDKYTRADNGTCIPEDQCEPQCPIGEIFEKCPDNLCTPLTCSQLGFPIPCPSGSKCLGKPRCICANGNVRDENGKCIPKHRCPSCGGDSNATPGCGVNCGKKCSDYKVKNHPCPRICHFNGCDCKKGYVYDDNYKKCVLPSECTPTCGLNEVYDTCANGRCRRWNCSQSRVCYDPIKCEAGCSCQDGYSRNKNGVCIPEKECPGLCSRPHEYYDDCPQTCPPQTCESIGKVYACPAKPLHSKCKGRCMCEKGYFRNLIGECIREEDCRKCPGPHEYFSCGGACDNVCATLHEYNQTNCPIINIMCNHKCYCEKGYARDKNNICIPIHKCPEPKCPVGEVYKKCPDNLCTPETCSQLGFPVPCPKALEVSGSNCLGKPRCVCAHGNVRDENGKCIPKYQCPSCGGDPNARPGCGVNCGKKCSDYRVKNHRCPEICHVNGCDCKKGYVYDDNCKKCVLPSECTETCGINEVYDTCANRGCRKWRCSQPEFCKRSEKCEGGCVCRDKYTRADNGTCIPEDQCEPQCPIGEIFEKCPDNLCIPQTCSQLGFPIPCPSGSKCLGKPRCICANGNVRDENGKCIPKHRCPSCGGDSNATPGCGVNCGKKCSDYKVKNPMCPMICHDNGCDCKKGYVYDDNCKKCVLPSECTPTCGLNEKYDTCANGGCRRWNCSQSDIVCYDPMRCEAGCSCQDGYSRNKNGVCIPEKQCPGLCSRPHEYYDDCPQTCPPQTCKTIGKVYACPAKPLHSKCKGRCMCEKGYFRNLIGECISEEDCKKCPGPHEYFSCGGVCDNVCATLHKYNQTNCPFINIRCNRKCYCETGYARDRNNICIPIHKCPEQQCGPNEIYDECPDALCYPQKCSQLGFRIDCKTSKSLATPYSSCPGKPGCICDNGYVRDKNGKCIPPEKCPSCGGDPNAVTGCGNHCGRRCSDHKDKNIVCPLYCVLNGCMCRYGFVYDDNLKKCVRPKDCTPTCGINEVYDTCANGGCRRWNCSKFIHCMNDVKCKAGCSCKIGFSRANNGTCIPEDKCPEPECGPNERYERCPDTLCSPQKCSQLGFPIDCKTSTSLATPNSSCPGKPGCVCDNGYVRDKNGKCIPEEKCPSCGGDPNAVAGCGNHCGRRCSDHKNKNTVCRPYCVPNGCTCRVGFVYDDNLKKCVHPKQCTPTCGINEVYDTCANGGCRRWNCSKFILCKDHVKCEAGCSCKKGYSRAKNGICIPEDKCPEPECGPNERYEQCPDTLCSPQKCSQLGFPIHCKTPTLPATPNSSCPGKPGCVCDNDYVRDQNGRCIPPEKCPSCGGDPNAVKGCGINCGRLCSNYDKGPVACIQMCKVNSCDCKHGFVLDKNTGKCVLPKDCTPICGKNEVYSECINRGCERKYCYQLGKPVPCVKMNAENCVKGCLCKEKYLRADNGTCIPEKQCTKRCTRPHEYYETCARSCPPQTCASIGRKYHCPLQRKPCKGACRCEKGYYRNKIGECITAKDCKKCTGPHEYFSCGKECDNVCATLHRQNQTHCPIINKTCKRKCYCEKGYARNDRNICIPIKQCQVPVCGKNERYEDDPSKLCGPLKCSDLGRPLDHTPAPNHNYKPACICKEGYLRDDHGLCVPKSQCRPVCGKNEKYEDNPSLCGPLKCSDLGRPLDDTSVKNPKQNHKPACICKEGYLRDDHGLCVPKSQCPPVCGKNERYEDDPSKLCGPLKCSDLGRPLDHTPAPNHNYKPACICKEGYLRDHHGLCVPESQCPPCN